MSFKINVQQMKKIVYTYGLISGVVVSLMLILSMPLHNNGVLDSGSGMVVGYATMVIALSVIFIAVRTFRDRHGNGSISFAKAFQIGMLITILASVLYALSWEVCYNTIARDFIPKMTESYMKQKQESGASLAELEQARKEMADFETMYRNPVIRFGYTLLEIIPVGVFITLLCALILRRKNVLPDVPSSEMG
jgi:hypothetical protein